MSYHSRTRRKPIPRQDAPRGFGIVGVEPLHMGVAELPATGFAFGLTGEDDEIVAANLIKTLKNSRFLTIDKEMKISYNPNQVMISELTPDLFL